MGCGDLYCNLLDMNKYTYTDNKTGTVVLTLYADSILIADTQFLQTLGYKPEKNPFIGCAIEKQEVSPE